MSELAASLPRIKRWRRPPKALVWKAAQCLLWAIWTIACAFGILAKHQYVLPSIFLVVYAKWMIRSYRELVKMIEAWLDDKLVKMPAKLQSDVIFTGALTIVLCPLLFGLPYY